MIPIAAKTDTFFSTLHCMPIVLAFDRHNNIFIMRAHMVSCDLCKDICSDSFGLQCFGVVLIYLSTLICLGGYIERACASGYTRTIAIYIFLVSFNPAFPPGFFFSLRHMTIFYLGKVWHAVVAVVVAGYRLSHSLMYRPSQWASVFLWILLLVCGGYKKSNIYIALLSFSILFSHSLPCSCSKYALSLSAGECFRTIPMDLYNPWSELWQPH